jgi:Ricin-type beta-trefoil lectin domain-like
MFFRRKTAGAVLAATAAVGLTTAAALPASASTSSYFEIFVQVSTNAPAMCLQPANPAGGAGTAVVQQPCSVGSQAQNWAPVNTTGTTYEFLNQASGMCLDVRGGAARNTPIEQWPCGNISNEHWIWPHSFPDAFWPLASQVAGSSGFCLDVPGASTQAGLAVQLYTCNGTAAQAWAIAGPVS